MMKKLFTALLLLVLSVSVTSAQFTDQRTWGGTAGGSANALTLTISNWPTTPAVGVAVTFFPNVANTTTATVAISGQGGSSGTYPIYKKSGAGPVALIGGELQPNQPVVLLWNASLSVYVIQNGINDAIAAITTPPEGYLTPCNYANSPSVSGCTANQMLPTSDVSGVAAVYYGTWFGNQIPIYNGSALVNINFSELSLSLPSSFASGTIRDVCVFLNSGAPTLVLSTAWTTSTAGSGNRGTGASTAQIALIAGVWTNAVTINGVNGSTTYSNIPANECTVVGSLLASANGQITWSVAYGQSRQIDVANIYNRQPIGEKAGDSTASWADANNSSFGPVNGTANNSLEILLSLPTKMSLTYNQNINQLNEGMQTLIGIGVDSTTTTSGTRGAMYTYSSLSGVGNTLQTNPVAMYAAQGTIGAHVITALSKSVTNTATLYGTETDMQLRAEIQQ
jgi:hypothetical protein